MKCASEGCRAAPTQHYTSVGKKPKGGGRRPTLMHLDLCRVHERRFVKMLVQFFDPKGRPKPMKG